MHSIRELSGSEAHKISPWYKHIKCGTSPYMFVEDSEVQKFRPVLVTASDPYECVQ